MNMMTAEIKSDSVGRRSFLNAILPSRLRHFILLIFLGQLVSLNITTTIVLTNKLYISVLPAGMLFSNTMSVLNYLLLFVTFTMYWIVTRPKKFLQVLKRCWKVYAIMSFFDFEATYCLNKAFGLTSSLSATVLNSSTVPFTVCLSYVFLKTRYRWKHYMSILLCLGGMGILVFEDLRQNRISNDVSPFANIPLGDALALFAGFSYSVAAISQEYAIKSFGSPAEYCVFLGFFGSIFSLSQLLVFERQELNQWSQLSAETFHSTALYMGVWLIFMWTLYSGAPYFFHMGGSATLFNLNLLTVNFYTVAFTVLLFKQFSFTPIYYCAFAVIIASLVVFNWNPEDLKTLFTERAEERKTQEKFIADVGEKCDLAKSENVELNAVKYM